MRTTATILGLMIAIAAFAGIATALNPLQGDDWEHDPEIHNPCVARCLACGQLWCPDCGELFKDDRFADHDCPVWEEVDFGDDDSDQAD